MSVLADCKALIEGLSIPVETGVFEGTAPETYVVIVIMNNKEVNYYGWMSGSQKRHYYH